MSDEILRKAREKEAQLRRDLRALREARKRLGGGAGPSGYEAHKQRAAERFAELSESGRDIGPIPKCKDEQRRERCRTSFRLFLETYFAGTFYLEWSPDHLEIIAAVEAAVLRGELLAFAMPRGSGKTSIIEGAALWALLFGYRDFVAIIASEEDHACSMLESIKVECETNELLLEDFPEAIFPIVQLERINNRARGQTCEGRATHIKWKEKEIQFPTVPGSAASGGIIKVSGILGGIRGMSAKRVRDGKKVRPRLVLVDDPQTDDSARSRSQVAKREAVLKGAILGLAGPDVQIAGLATVTVVVPGDLADRLLDRKAHPAWQGRRMKLVYDWPTDSDLWQKYAELRQQGQREGSGTEAADRFYLKNREGMDAGSRVAWPARKSGTEASAIQHAWNLRIDRGETAFWAEFQNEPLPVVEQSSEELTASQIAEKLNRYPRQAIPLACQHLTMFIDCQRDILYWVVCAWEENFSGYVIDYGTYPDQRRPYFTVREITKRLSSVSKAKSVEGALLEGLEVLTSKMLTREWKREDGASMRIERCLVDANYLSDTVYQFCRESARAGVVMPSHGQGVRAASTPFSMYARKPGDRIGHYWRIPNVQKKRLVRHVQIDTNYWKSFVHSRLATPRGDPGCLSLFGDSPEAHRMLADHLVAEYRVATTAKGRTVEEWHERPSKDDNHWLDGVVGCAVAASMLGAVLPGAGGFKPPKRQRVSFAQLQARKRGQA